VTSSIKVKLDLNDELDLDLLWIVDYVLVVVESVACGVGYTRVHALTQWHNIAIITVNNNNNNNNSLRNIR